MDEVGVCEHKLIRLLRDVDTDTAIDLVKSVRLLNGDQFVHHVLLGIGSEENGIGLLACTLLTLLIAQEDEALWHEIARDILAYPLCHYPFAEGAAVVHARRACELNPESLRNWESLLDIGCNQARYLSEEAKHYAMAQVKRIELRSA